jgi:2-polyprenyl-3-methyl-5-hydroxy-6-metoxy-1,4-benzoquinol methylase
MKQLPLPDIYERELFYMPYRVSVNEVINYVISNAPKNGSVLDLMCGPGWMLNQIKIKRPDLNLFGVDIDKRYISHSKKKYLGIKFEEGDVLVWKTGIKFDVVLCTGSIHHLPYEKQEDFIKRIPGLIAPKGFSILSDCHIDDYNNETERKLAAAKLGYEYLIQTIKNGADNEVIDATADIINNDVSMNEYKTSTKKRFPIYKKYFSKVEVNKTWPKDKNAEYGDYWVVCRP